MVNSVESKPRRALGRSLGDFENLSWAEKKLIACARRGKPCVLGDRVPDAPTRANAVRPELIRFLALGGDGDAPVHERGVVLQGAYVGSVVPRVLDLSSARLSVYLGIYDSRFDAPLVLRDMEGISLGLGGSAFPGILGDGLKLGGNLLLGRVRSTGEVRLLGARIGRNLECPAGRFEEVDSDALSCDGAEIGGDVSFRNGFLAIGTVRLPGVQIGGNLSCSRGRINNAGGAAMICDGSNIGGHVFFREGFHATGDICLRGIHVGGNLECDGGRFENADGRALSCEGAEIKGALFLRGGVSTEGVLSFAHARVAVLADEIDRWPDRELILDGFRYDRIAATSELDARRRIAWLMKQQPRFLTSETFALQPWMQLAKVLREQGHFRDAAEVDIARENHLRAAGLVGDPSALRKWMEQWGQAGADGSYGVLLISLGEIIAWGLHWVYGWFSGYGHRPMRILYAAVFFWVALGFAYEFTASRAHFAPSNPATIKAVKDDCLFQFEPAPVNWTQCDALLAAYPRFSPFAYSLDLILPVVRLGQSTLWTPISDGSWSSLSGWTQRFVWFEEIFGWVAALTLGAIATGLVKRRDG